MTASTAASATERLETALARIAANAFEGSVIFTRLYAEEARLAAAAADLRKKEGRPLGPLDGALVSIKALYDVAGEVTTAGSRALRNRPPAARDARAVARLRAAGAVIVGKTVMTELAFSGVGLNPHDGDARNPADRSRIPGGSSAGAVASVMEGLVEIGLGSDTGGSVRIPAALCGAVGLKPTSGLVPTDGAFPLSFTLDTIGPIARNVDTAALALAILREEPAALPQPAALSRCRFVVPRGRLIDDAEEGVRAAFEAGLTRLAAAGAEVREGSLDVELDAIAALDAIAMIPAIELAAILRDHGVDDLALLDPKIRARIEACKAVPASDYARLIAGRTKLVRETQARWGSEIYVLPTVPLVAPTIASLRDDGEFARVNGRLLRNTRVANLLDTPSISLPLPVAGLPVGLMLLARRGEDAALIAAARAVELALKEK